MSTEAQARLAKPTKQHKLIDIVSVEGEVWIMGNETKPISIIFLYYMWIGKAEGSDSEKRKLKSNLMHFIYMYPSFHPHAMPYTKNSGELSW